MPISETHSNKYPASDYYWRASLVVSTLCVALSVIALSTLLATTGSSYYVYGVAAFGVLTLATTVVSCFKLCTRSSQPVKAKSIKKPPVVVKEPPKVVNKPPDDVLSEGPKKSPDIEIPPVEKAPEVIPIHEDFEFEGVTLRRTTLTLENFDAEDFKSWVNCMYKSEQKAALLEHTVLKALDIHNHQEPITFVFYQIFQSQEKFGDLLKQPLTNSLSFESNIAWYEYALEGHTYIDFANAISFGGGWRDCGSVQEERMFCEFFKLALLAYISGEKAKLDILPATSSPDYGAAEPTPFIIPDVKPDWLIDKAIYGSKALDQVPVEKISKYVRPAMQRSRPVTITGIAARHWRESNGQNRYSEDDLIYHVKAAYLAFYGEKCFNPENLTVTSGAWGCGAFANSEKMMIALQLLAAKMAGVKLIFSGINNNHLHNYTDKKIVEISKIIDSETTPKAVLDKLLTLQKQDPANWAPKV